MSTRLLHRWKKRIDRLTAVILLLVDYYPELKQTLTLLAGIKGIAETSVIALMGVLLLPPGLSHREWFKFARLEPKALDSGPDTRIYAIPTELG
ncbi:MAG: hypothetical protein Q8N35_02785 [Methylococcaceae bacterium]|jgi:hypothetical protein|nr:hypothetical protein [Methylococcaceae bacterium]MDZ4156908.1 hypothetical protein [Methylococcales bacterium]MDP2394044.1 hypothetical protein [Methylococcaceae bacterium]MDP3018492.1 hypothetical protein [Methylococcaceae bacterium]MDP3390982.1 hypothetical protein [Methylococcaceae bacterium]